MGMGLVERDTTVLCRKQNFWTGDSLEAAFLQGPLQEQMLFHVFSNGCHRKERSVLMKFNDGTEEGGIVYIGDIPNIMEEILVDNEEKRWQP